MIVARVGAQFEVQGCRIERIDGIKIHLEDGWALFRRSNTQPAVTLHCEARTAGQLANIEAALLGSVREALRDAGSVRT